MAARPAGAAARYGFAAPGGDTNRAVDTSITICMTDMAGGIFPQKGAADAAGARRA